MGFRWAWPVADGLCYGVYDMSPSAFGRIAASDEIVLSVHPCGGVSGRSGDVVLVLLTVDGRRPGRCVRAAARARARALERYGLRSTGLPCSYKAVFACVSGTTSHTAVRQY